MTRIACLAAVVAVAGCAAEVADVEPLGDYTTWKRIDTYGKAPGHGDTYRIIYLNDVAAAYDRSVGHVDGEVVVKEVYKRAAGSTPAPGPLSVIEIMRRIGTDTSEDGGWTFTAASTPGGEETLKTFCWRRCHQAAPFEGAWFDYSQ